MPVEIVAVPARTSGHPHLAEMIERHYGALLDGAHTGIAGRLDALEAELEQASREAADDV